MNLDGMSKRVKDTLLLLGGGALAILVFKKVKALLQQTLQHDKPIIVSGGSLYVSSRSKFSTVLGRLQVSELSHAAGAIDISQSGDDLSSYTPDSGTAWTLQLKGDHGSLTISSTGNNVVAFSGSASDFDNVLANGYMGQIMKHKVIVNVSEVDLTATINGLAISIPLPVTSKTFYLVIHYGNPS